MSRTPAWPRDTAGKTETLTKKPAASSEAATAAVRSFVRPELDEADGRAGTHQALDPSGRGQDVEEVDAASELCLQHVDLVRKKDARRSDRGTELRRWQRPREDQRATAGEDTARELRLGQHHAASSGGERLVQAERHRHPWVQAPFPEHDPGAVPPRPADPMRVVDIREERGSTVEHFEQRVQARDIAMHAVDAVAQVKDAPMLLGQAARAALAEACAMPVLGATSTFHPPESSDKSASSSSYSGTEAYERDEENTTPNRSTASHAARFSRSSVSSPRYEQLPKFTTRPWGSSIWRPSSRRSQRRSARSERRSDAVPLSQPQR